MLTTTTRQPMTTVINTLSATVANITTENLCAAVDEARANMLQAWRTQSVTTLDEGFTYLQAEIAIWQAQTAQAIFEYLHDEYEKRITAEFVKPVCYHMRTARTQVQRMEYGEAVVTEWETCIDCGEMVEDLPEYDELPY